MTCDVMFEPLHDYTESYSIKYWDKSGEFARQKEITLYAKTKDSHKKVVYTVMRTFKVKIDDIISIRLI